MAALPPDFRHNQLLAALPQAALERWLPLLEPIALARGRVLYESGQPLTQVIFPTTAVVSLLYVMENGDSAEIAVVGNEGLVGVPVFTGGNSAPGRAVVRSAGQGWSLNAQAAKDEFQRGGPVMHLLLHYTQALIAQISQNAVCGHHHTLDQQLCRWLLMSLDRAPTSELVITHGLIASLLGVRRESITELALKLQAAGLISYVRGHITVLDRPALEQRSCECYAVVKREFDRLLPKRPAL